MREEVKSCPWCDSEATLWKHGLGMFSVGCSNPGCNIAPETRRFAKEKVAIHIWNSRLAYRGTEVKTNHEVEQDGIKFQYETNSSS